MQDQRTRQARSSSVGCDPSINDESLLALAVAALLLNGLVKVDTADGEKLGFNF
jgi:hypothetical protein